MWNLHLQRAWFSLVQRALVKIPHKKRTESTLALSLRLGTDTALPMLFVYIEHVTACAYAYICVYGHARMYARMQAGVYSHTEQEP